VTRRRLASVAVAVALGGGTLAAMGAGSGDGAYRVRAVFDNASFVIPGEDVKVAGVRAGVIDSLDLTAGHKAVVVLRIDDPAFKPFRVDASCRIGLQSLIGEQFVECQPTKPHGDGIAAAAELPAIGSGPGKGQHLLGIQHTSSPVGPDLINTIMRMPERERFRIILNELGTGLAGNGTELREAIRRSSPALQQADRLVRTLADQNRVLARLVDDSDRVLAPLATHRKALGGFIQHAGETATATAERGDDLEQDLSKLPAFLRELRPAAQRFGALADQMTPALQSLAAQAPAINGTVERFGPFTAAATPALRTLGDVAQRGRSSFPKLQSTVEQLGALARPLRPLASNLAQLSTSFDKSGGVEDLMRFISFYTGTVNGEDALGHYIRSGLEVSACSSRDADPAPGCESTFDSSGDSSDASSAGDAGTARASALLDYLLAPGEPKR
jgi:ABC-type transporter Mla subunit MlaD